MQDFFPELKEVKLENALYVAATPIGNLSDITLRALQLLRKVDFVVCEDTRVSAKLLDAYKIKDKKLLTYNDHCDEKNRQKILDLLVQGCSIALISDAGTPLISDPGYKLIRFLRDHNQKIIPIPGASSVVSAISASGIACDNFLFLGFIPTSEVQKEKLIKSLPKNFTFVFFEAANRITETLNLIQKTIGNRRVCVARELTKVFEEIISDELNNVLKTFAENSERLRGEFVIIVEKADKNNNEIDEEMLLEEIRKAIAAGYSVKDLSQNLSEIFSVSKRDIYQLALKIPHEKNS